MKFLLKTAKYTMSLLLLVGLVFSSGVFSVLLYAKITGREIGLTDTSGGFIAFAETGTPPAAAAAPTPAPPVSVKSAMLEAPVIRQYPELRSGCEVTSLTMLLQFYGLPKTKLELAQEMKKDPTGMTQDADGAIVYWGNPNNGFVGDVTGKSRGFGIYHSALLELLQKYVPGGFDLTGSTFETVEKQVAAGVPVVVWTTVDFSVPENWVVWDTPIGPIRTTFAEHAVLLVGFDEQSVYVNDPLTGIAKTAVNKDQFIESWNAMGGQAISYHKS